ncbi:MAG TPA: sulfite exporter TauE/SafE family protein [Oscillatoriaceae cyanobacterium M33_DOE_052]|uniref:Probable membrane transporter protein n=1 Tax=Planktothricoides sp. SpSt-374 TaxID=2282167 RepID=A0A7C3ZLW6_9CYAN|nr:sulfite exporter TauE/SafE family protein [Oscillatoriaceae cyanobacterium M33_DOE_052]
MVLPDWFWELTTHVSSSYLDSLLLSVSIKSAWFGFVPSWLLLFFVGIGTGIASGVLGIGGGLLMVPVLTFSSLAAVQATATSLLAVLLSAISGSIRNWRAQELNIAEALGLAVPGILTAPLGAWLGDCLPDKWLTLSFAVLQLTAIYLMGLRQRLQQTPASSNAAIPETASTRDSQIANIFRIVAIGFLAGLLAGLFGVGGGVIMVPLQVLLLKSSIKDAVRSSLGAIVLIATAGLIPHSLSGNVWWQEGFALGIGGIFGAQIGTRLLPYFQASTVTLLFRSLLLALSFSMIWRALVP